MTAFTPVDPANPQRETIYTQLKNAIINGDIAPDERIVETKYADIFRVSRTPVREAIRMLEREGLVVYEPRKGAVARPRLTRAEVDEVYTIRSALQLLSVDAVVRNITDAQLDAMEADNRGCAEALDKHDVGAYFRHLDEFNGLLTQSSNMPLLIKLLTRSKATAPPRRFRTRSTPASARACCPMTNAAAVRWRSTRRSWRPCGPVMRIASVGCSPPIPLTFTRQPSSATAGRTDAQTPSA